MLALLLNGDLLEATSPTMMESGVQEVVLWMATIQDHPWAQATKVGVTKTMMQVTIVALPTT